MKNKKALYALLPLVVIIWGIIFYKIFLSINHSSDGMNIRGNKNEKVAETNCGMDTFSIRSDYRDPFLGRMTGGERTAAENFKEKEVQVPKVIAPLKWPTVIYGGLIKNNKSKKQLAIVQINGKENIVKEGEGIDGVSLVKAYRDSIEVIFEKEKKVIKR